MKNLDNCFNSYLEFQGNFIKMESQMDMMEFIQSDTFLIIKNLFIKKLINSRTSLENVNYLKLLLSVGLNNMDNIRLDNSWIPFWKHLTTILIKSITMDMGEELLKNKQFLSFKNLIAWQSTMKNWDDYVVNRHTPNFTNEQSKIANMLKDKMVESSSKIKEDLLLLKNKGTI